jgi:hypothetical protein
LTKARRQAGFSVFGGTGRRFVYDALARHKSHGFDFQTARHCDDNGHFAISLNIVIASAAKQSILPLLGELDCFAALAMT